MLPVIESSSAIILLLELAIQYAPEAPTSLITATFGFPRFLTASANSLEAITVPPGELISRTTAFIELSSLAFFNAFNIESTSALELSNGNDESEVEIIPFIGITTI